MDEQTNMFSVLRDKNISPDKVIPKGVELKRDQS